MYFVWRLSSHFSKITLDLNSSLARSLYRYSTAVNTLVAVNGFNEVDEGQFLKAENLVISIEFSGKNIEFISKTKNIINVFNESFF